MSRIDVVADTVHAVPAHGLQVIQASDVAAGKHEMRADVVVIGSGAGGAVAAYELARKGLDVLILEAGPYVPSSEFSEDFNESLERLYEDYGGQTNKEGDLLLLQGRCVGGSTVVNGCVSFRTPDFILEEWGRDFGLTNLSPAAMQPWFERVEKHLSIEENGEHEIAGHSRLVRDGAKKLGWSVKPFKRNIRDCALTGHCLSGCKTDRKQSMLVTYLPWAMAHGARLHADTRVTRILENGGRAVGVEAEVIGHDGIKVADIRVDANTVVLAAGAVQSPLLLQKSGLGNSSGQVGKNFACHPSMFVSAKYPQEVFPWRGALLGVYVDEFLHPSKGGFLLEAGGLGAVEMTMLNEPGTGKPFMKFMEEARFKSGIVTLIHDHNVGEIRWEDGRKVVDYQVSDKDFPSMLAALKASAQIHFAAGATEVYVPSVEKLIIRNEDEIDAVLARLENKPQRLRLVSYHPQGSLRMGADPARSVVAPHGEVHDVKGLYVTDASLLPTSIIVNPQVTVYALASYISQEILTRL
ncbi:MAG: GMC family oxidoreductase [Alcanivoracaceae bacterium]|jgi:choline dehydrogenase-like flavoprotein|nr:GMC family oxidoreductase [Alcanivoracaceae bacterium]